MTALLFWFGHSHAASSLAMHTEHQSGMCSASIPSRLFLMPHSRVHGYRDGWTSVCRRSTGAAYLGKGEQMVRDETQDGLVDCSRPRRLLSAKLFPQGIVHPDVNVPLPEALFEGRWHIGNRTLIHLHTIEAGEGLPWRTLFIPVLTLPGLLRYFVWMTVQWTNTIVKGRSVLAWAEITVLLSQRAIL